MRSLILSALVLAPAVALAQTAAPQTHFETVYSDAQKAADQDLSRRFITGVLAPSLSFENQYAKWNRGICPNVLGLSATAKYVLERRIRDVATQVHAPVDREDPCLPNITIIVTPQPQATLDSIAAIAPYLVIGGKQRQLTVTHPIQSWYTTFRRDFSGLAQLDLPWEDRATASGGATGVDPGLTATDPNVGVDGGVIGNTMGGINVQVTNSIERDIPRVVSQGTRLSTGITAEMAGVVIIVDSKAIMGMSLGSLGDYAAFLSLAQAPVTGRCQEAPTIANLMAQGCATDVKTSNLSNVDIAMLTGLYDTPEKPEMLQRPRIIGAMRRTLESQFTH
jgi:hypothetical protein